MATLDTAEKKARALAIVRKLAGAIYDTVGDAGPDGAPEGPLYLAFQAHDIPLNIYQAIVDSMVRNGFLTRRGHVLFRGSFHWDRPL